LEVIQGKQEKKQNSKIKKRTKPGIKVSSPGFLCHTEGFLYSVKDKLYPRLLGSDLIASYCAPSCELQLFLPSVKILLTKKSKKL